MTIRKSTLSLLTAFTFSLCVNSATALPMYSLPGTPQELQSKTEDLPGDFYIMTQLYFGLSSNDGNGISEQEWTDFLEDVVTPKFPHGLTVLDSSGQWKKGENNIVREQGKVLVLVHKSDAESEANIKAIADSYKSTFKQDSVMRVNMMSITRF